MAYPASTYRMLLYSDTLLEPSSIVTALPRGWYTVLLVINTPPVA